MKRKSAASKKPVNPTSQWQNSEYKRFADFHFNIPRQFLMLCRLMHTTPQQLLGDFMDNLSCGTPNRKGRDKAKDHLISYFVEHGYGNKQFSREDILSIFKEMDAIGLLYPSGGDEAIVKIHAHWREKYWNYWFSKWLKKII